MATPLPASPPLPVSSSPHLPTLAYSTILGPAQPTDAEQAIDRAKAAEIAALDDGAAATARRLDRYLELVVLPLAVLVVLVLLLRRGLFS